MTTLSLAEKIAQAIQNCNTSHYSHSWKETIKVLQAVIDAHQKEQDMKKEEDKALHGAESHRERLDIPIGDKRHDAAKRLLEVGYEFWKSFPMTAVRWLEDTSGQLVVFTRGEYKEAIRQAIGENHQPEEFFQDVRVEKAGWPLNEKQPTPSLAENEKVS